MTSQPPNRDPRKIWQNQKTETTTMSVEEVRRKAEKFRNRNRRDLIARSAFAVIAAVFCGYVFFNARITSVGAIAGLVMAMLLTSTVRNLFLSRRRHINRTPDDTGPNTALSSCVEFYRNELERQLEIARQPAWQLAIALLIIGWLTRNAWVRTSADPLRIVLLGVLFAAAGLTILLALRRFGARGVQDEIDALERLEGEEKGGL
jgi:hypothetical protein